MSDHAIFVDTSVLLRLLLEDHPDHSPRAFAFFEEVNQGRYALWISDSVIFETVYVLEKSYGRARNRIAQSIAAIMELPYVFYMGLANHDDVFNLYMMHPQLSIADCLHASLARRLPSSTILSFDRDFDRVSGLIRIEPAPLENDQ